MYIASIWSVSTTTQTIVTKPKYGTRTNKPNLLIHGWQEGCSYKEGQNTTSQSSALHFVKIIILLILCFGSVSTSQEDPGGYWPRWQQELRALSLLFIVVVL